MAIDVNSGKSLMLNTNALTIQHDVNTRPEAVNHLHFDEPWIADTRCLHRNSASHLLVLVQARHQFFNERIYAILKFIAQTISVTNTRAGVDHRSPSVIDSRCDVCEDSPPRADGLPVNILCHAATIICSWNG